MIPATNMSLCVRYLIETEMCSRVLCSSHSRVQRCVFVCAFLCMNYTHIIMHTYIGWFFLLTLAHLEIAFTCTSLNMRISISPSICFPLITFRMYLSLRPFCYMMRHHMQCTSSSLKSHFASYSSYMEMRNKYLLMIVGNLTIISMLIKVIEDKCCFGVDGWSILN